MRYDINSYINAIVKDNEQYIAESGCSSIAEYIITSAESANSWHEFFDDKELEDGDPTNEQIVEFKDYLHENWDEMPDPALQAIKAYELSMSGESVDYKITSVVGLKDGAKLHLFEGAGIESSAISYADGTTFVLTDWQGSRPESEEEIADYDWRLASDGRKAIVMDGLPRIF